MLDPTLELGSFSVVFLICSCCFVCFVVFGLVLISGVYIYGITLFVGKKKPISWHIKSRTSFGMQSLFSSFILYWIRLLDSQSVGSSHITKLCLSMTQIMPRVESPQLKASKMQLKTLLKRQNYNITNSGRTFHDD